MLTNMAGLVSCNQNFQFLRGTIQYWNRNPGGTRITSNLWNIFSSLYISTCSFITSIFLFHCQNFFMCTYLYPSINTFSKFCCPRNQPLLWAKFKKYINPCKKVWKVFSLLGYQLVHWENPPTLQIYLQHIWAIFDQSFSTMADDLELQQDDSVRDSEAMAPPTASLPLRVFQQRLEQSRLCR